MVSAAPFEEIRRHLRRFLRVKDERGRRLLFRYYDPIVLAAFLPTCTAAELAEVFGPIDAFLVETVGPDCDLTEIRFDGVVLHTKIRAAMDDAAVPRERRIEAMLHTTTEADGQTARATPDDAEWKRAP